MTIASRVKRALAFVAALALGAGLLSVASAPATAAEPPSGQLALSGNLNLHDPTVYRDGDTYYAAASHRGIWSAPSLNGPWTNIGNVPAADWTASSGRALWAPHVQKIGDTFFYYYSTSSFGTNNSAIGLKTTQTPGIPSSYVDHGGPIVTSGTLSPTQETFNAIDPAVHQDDDGNWWMVWGSHFDGIFIQQLADDMVTLVGEPVKVADRESEQFPIDNPNFNRIEGPSVFKHGDWYYLLTAWDWCCRGNGNDNTYKIVAGRSATIDGPYLDKNGVDLAEGGGSIILNSRMTQPGVTPEGLHRAPGAPDFLVEGDTVYFIYHSYMPGTVLGIRPFEWDGGWPYFPESKGPYEVTEGASYALRLQAGSIDDPNSLQNPEASETCLTSLDGLAVGAACEEPGAAQAWRLESLGDAFYQLRSQAGDRETCLTMADLSGTEGTGVAVEPCADDERQHWYFDDTGHGFQRLVGRTSNLALEATSNLPGAETAVFGGHRRDGDHQAGNLTQAAKWPYQQWRFEKLADALEAPTITTLDGAANAIVGDEVDLAVTVRGESGELVSGHVSLWQDGDQVDSATLVDGDASFAIAADEVGVLSLTARFHGAAWSADAEVVWNGSTSTELVVTVEPAPHPEPPVTPGPQEPGTAPPGTSPGGSGSGSGLASTGTDGEALSAIGLGALLLALGGMMLVALSRRSRV
ncbi:family 43 glycosylhydrolase [Agromyces silvae]|uniref:family 43 glycosylhydrolase n=1 Tax=Agromyces silvae TaxID=3388266 RepID=UPI00280BCA15|nr:family 43 glycosylhydrolase [Agromyces protaetiae]